MTTIDNKILFPTGLGISKTLKEEFLMDIRKNKYVDVTALLWINSNDKEKKEFGRKILKIYYSYVKEGYDNRKEKEKELFAKIHTTHLNPEDRIKVIEELNELKRHDKMLELSDKDNILINSNEKDEMNNFKNNNNLTDLKEKMLDTLDDKNKKAFTAKLNEHKGDIHETIRDIHRGEDEGLKQATDKLLMGKEFKQIKALEIENEEKMDEITHKLHSHINPEERKRLNKELEELKG